jgi:hypothetical protein
MEPFAGKDVEDWRQKIDSLSEHVEDRIKRLEKISSMDAPMFESTHLSSIDQGSSVTQGSTLPFQLDFRDSSAFCSWGSRLLRLMIEKAYCMLYQPLIREPSSSLWQEFRSASVSYLKNPYVAFLIELQLDPALSFTFRYLLGDMLRQLLSELSLAIPRHLPSTSTDGCYTRRSMPSTRFSRSI